jgi:hypothetical protein
MELPENVFKNLESNAKDMVDKFTFNTAWYEVVIALITEIRRLRKKYND